MKVTRKAAIVTGAAQGIGRAMAMKLADEGAMVVVNDVNIETANHVVGEITHGGGTAIAVRADVTNRSEIRDLVKTTLEKFKSIDILINNAGITRHAPLADMTEEVWDVTLDVNLKSVFNCIQAVAPCMMQRRYGKIISIASVGGLGFGFSGNSSYAVSKGGIIQLTKAAAREFGPYGINVNCIAPGTIRTDMTFARRTKEEVERFIERQSKLAVLGRIGDTEDIANLALFLASDDAKFITAQVIRCDGGRADGM